MSERARLAASAAYRPPKLLDLRLVAANHVTGAAGEGHEAWLRNLLKACDQAVNDLRETDTEDARTSIADLDHVRTKVQRQLTRLAATADK